MGILVLLAVFTADAADGSGRGFAIVYATYQVVQTWLWYASGVRTAGTTPSSWASRGAMWPAWACRRW